MKFEGDVIKTNTLVDYLVIMIIPYRLFVNTLSY